VIDMRSIGRYNYVTHRRGLPENLMVWGETREKAGIDSGVARGSQISLVTANLSTDKCKEVPTCTNSVLPVALSVAKRV